jgi:DNA repair protein RadC
MKTNQLINDLQHVCEVSIGYSVKVKAADRKKITRSGDAENLFRPWYDNTGLFEQKEVFTVLLLNRANQAMGILKVSEGSASACVVDIQYIFRAAILAGASGLVLCHNHPSGAAQPSRADEALTLTLKSALALVDVRVLDHMIVTRAKVLSFAEEGLI